MFRVGNDERRSLIVEDLYRFVTVSDGAMIQASSHFGVRIDPAGLYGP